MKNYFDNKLIVIDDSSFARATIFTMLKKMGFRNIDLPEDSAEAWELIASSLVDGDSYDLVLTDLNMPGIDGMELIKKIKSDPGSKHLKVMVISADGDEIVIDEAKNLGALDYLIKPVEYNHFENSLKKILD